MRVVVTGVQGQVVTALQERSVDRPGLDLISLGRPQIDLNDLDSIAPALRRTAPDVIISAAAYTAVDRAESEEDLAGRINGDAPGVLATIGSELGIPILQISTDYVFDGRKPDPYVEDDVVGPLGAYGRTKLAGEVAVQGATSNYAILRTAWVYSPFGNNFVKTMLRLAADRDELGIVADQYGNPTSALDIADAVLTVARRMVEEPDNQAMRGIFHLSATGSTNWAGFAAEVLRISAERGGATAAVRPITTAEFPTPAPRPANSQLNNDKLDAVFGVRLPAWQDSTRLVVERLVG